MGKDDKVMNDRKRSDMGFSSSSKAKREGEGGCAPDYPED